MKKLFKIKSIMINGSDGTGFEKYSYIVSDSENIKDQADITKNNMISTSRLFLEYNTYENIGSITDVEIQTLIKFGIIF